MSNPLFNLLDTKGAIGTIIFVSIVGILLIVLNKLKESPLGENEDSKQAIENAEKSINILTNSYFLAGMIGGIVALVAFFIWLFRQTNNGGVR